LGDGVRPGPNDLSLHGERGVGRAEVHGDTED
jgi:hypothetical protein